MGGEGGSHIKYIGTAHQCLLSSLYLSHHDLDISKSGWFPRMVGGRLSKLQDPKVWSAFASGYIHLRRDLDKLYGLHGANRRPLSIFQTQIDR
jgi:hypothetical protein